MRQDDNFVVEEGGYVRICSEVEEVLDTEDGC